MSHLEALDETTFDQRVLGAREPVLVEFTATWCPPCKALAPVLESLAKEQAGRMHVVAVDGDASPALSNRFKVRSFPTTLAFVDGKEVARVVGLTSKERLLAMVPPR
jgi:thioredoxin 1